jgi:hypothetical protein
MVMVDAAAGAADGREHHRRPAHDHTAGGAGVAELERDLAARAELLLDVVELTVVVQRDRVLGRAR